MTGTTTADPTDVTDAENLVDAAERAAEEMKAKSLATMRPDQQRWDENQTAILRQIGLEDATQGDLDLFFHVCRTTGLDPFRRQIYMIGRNTKVTEWVENADGSGRRKQEKFVTKYTIQTGIDGYRRNVREAAKTLGDEIRFAGPWFTGENDFHVTDDGEVIQHWRKVWPLKTAPHAARFVIFRNGEEFEGIAHYDEFVQTNFNGEPNSMWAKMPRNQIAKCAEALAYRRAYPDDLSGLILEDSAQPTVIDQDGNIENEPRKRRPSGSGIDGVRAARERREAQRREEPPPVVVDGEVVPHEAEPAAADTGSSATAWTPQMRRKGLNRMHQLFGKGDVPKDDREDRLIVTAHIIGRTVESANDLTDDEIAKTNNQLDKWEQDGTLGQQITEILNQASLAEASAEERAAAAAEAAADAASENAESDLARREAEAEGVTE